MSTVTTSAIKRRAAELGFDLCGIAPAEAFPELQALGRWLAQGHAGRMTYLNRTARKRADVRHWLPSARSVISVACAYHTNRPLSVERADPDRAVIARYAWGDDYHDVLTSRLERLLAWMREVHPAPFDARVGVDDAPVQERVFASRAGLGWIGKNTCVINPGIGSWFVLGEIVTSLDLDADEPALDRCGTCQLCLDACPTGAIVEPYVLDARRCLSYLTIEIKKDIPEQQRPDLGSHVFGCDICQDVCPYNAPAPASVDAAWQPRPALEHPRLADLWRASDNDLEQAIAGTALRRRGVAGLRRNVAVALGNAGSAAASAVIRETPADAPTVADPVVRDHADWAIARLTSDWS
ncbi:MAG: tRNA epoxyqueuosine(34) reductase QueG [Vicinamibacterales bacterium]|nr:tRNA epoxyqueuosine(34) reductase QueG [Vicinamibacterales bacterium]